MQMAEALASSWTIAVWSAGLTPHSLTSDLGENDVLWSEIH